MDMTLDRYCDRDRRVSAKKTMSFFPTFQLHSLPLPLLSACIALLLSFNFMFGRKKWDPKGQHCYVTGGSQGTGLSLALLLVKQGAHVSIIARDPNKLQLALEKLEQVRQSPNQIIKWYSHSLSSYDGAAAALKEACEPFGGKAPDVIFNVAGSSKPFYFVEETGESLKNGMDNTYWVQAYPTLAATKMMVRQKAKGKIVLVGSTLAYFSMVGYTSYSPGKFAIRALSEALRNELKLYDIDVHMYYPCTVFSPGLIEENKRKPEVTLKLEETDSGITTEQAAEGILQTIRGGKFQHASDWLTKTFRAGTRGASPVGPFDFFIDLFAWIVIPIVRMVADYQVRAHRPKHEAYLQSIGFYEQ